jgi:hypothetical protein
MYPIAIIVVWLSAAGNVDGLSTGAAIDVDHCKAKAAQAITAESLKPESQVKGDKPLTLCYDTRADAAKYAPPAPSKPVLKPGSVDL